MQQAQDEPFAAIIHCKLAVAMILSHTVINSCYIRDRTWLTSGQALGAVVMRRGHIAEMNCMICSLPDECVNCRKFALSTFWIEL